MLNDSVITAPSGSRNLDEQTFRSAYFETIDTTTLELDRRFSRISLYEAVAALDPASDLFLGKEKLAYFQPLSIPVPSDEELKVAKSTLLRELATLENNGPNDVLHLLYDLKRAFPETYNMVASVATLGCSTALCESTFSALSRIDEPSRKSMSSSRKSNLSLLAFEHKRTEALDIQMLLSKGVCNYFRLKMNVVPVPVVLLFLFWSTICEVSERLRLQKPSQ